MRPFNWKKNSVIHKKFYTIREKPPQNIITTLALGSMINVAFQIPAPGRLLWQTMDEYQDSRLKKAHRRWWTKENDQKAFDFIRYDGSVVKTVFDRYVGFVTEAEFTLINSVNFKKRGKNGFITSLFFELTSICSAAGKDPVALPLPASDLFSETKSIAPSPKSASLGSPLTLFGWSQLPSLERPDWRNVGGQSNDTISMLKKL